MNDQPKALRLADEFVRKLYLSNHEDGFVFLTRELVAEAAAELRRLHGENKVLQEALETERMRLAACCTAALGYFDGCIDEYKSASLNEVLRLREAHDWQHKMAGERLRRIEKLEALLRQALDFCEFVWREVPMNDCAFERLEQIITAIRQHLENKS